MSVAKLRTSYSTIRQAVHALESLKPHETKSKQVATVMAATARIVAADAPAACCLFASGGLKTGRCRTGAPGEGAGERTPPLGNWVHNKIPGCAVELNTQNCAWFGSQISLITAMSFREAMPPRTTHQGLCVGWGVKLYSNQTKLWSALSTAGSGQLSVLCSLSVQLPVYCYCL